MSYWLGCLIWAGFYGVILYPNLDTVVMDYMVAQIESHGAES